MTARSVATLALAGALGLPTLAAAAPGDLDGGFGSGGFVVEDIFNTDQGMDVAIQPDGKILVAGRSSTSIPNFAVARFSTNGSLDTSFNAPNGKFSTELFGSNEMVYSMALQPDGKILVAGRTDAAGNNDFALMRLTHEGVLDTSFNDIASPTPYNGDGKFTIDIATGQDEAREVLVRPNGKVVIAGLYNIQPMVGGDIAVVQLNENGTPDASFGNGSPGVTKLTVGGGASAAALQADGKLVMAGNTSGPSPTQFLATRITEGGALDTGYGTSGRQLVSFGTVDYAQGVLVQPDGKAVLVGQASSGDGDFGVARLDTAGQPDNTFDGDGKTTVTLGGAPDTAEDVGLALDGRLVVSGASGSDLALAVLNPDGSLFDGFSGDGGAVFPRANNQLPGGLAVQPDGKFVMGGTESSMSNSGDFLLARAEGLPLPVLSVSNASAREASNAAFTVSLDKSSGFEVSVAYATANGSAAGSDYDARSGTLTLAPGETSQTVTVPLKADNAGETAEDFFLDLANPVNAALGDGRGRAEIANVLRNGTALRVLRCGTLARGRVSCRFRNPNPFAVSGSLSIASARKVPARFQSAARKRARKIKLTSKRFTIPAGATRTITAKLSRRGAKSLRLAKRLRAAVTVTIRDEAQVTRRAKRTVTLKVFKRKRRR